MRTRQQEINKQIKITNYKINLQHTDKLISRDISEMLNVTFSTNLNSLSGSNIFFNQLVLLLQPSIGEFEPILECDNIW